MKKIITTTLALLMVYGISMAQEYKLAKSSGKLVIKDVGSVSIEGYAGNEIVFTSMDFRHEKDERAVGLKAINSLGLEDNTGLGLSVIDKGATIEVYQLKKNDGPKIKIMVPKGVSISYTHSSPHGSNFKLKNIESEIEVSTVHNDVHLENVTGPMAIKTVHGDVDAILSDNIKNPVSIVSAHGAVDVTIASSAKLNISMATSYGEIFVDPAIKIEFESKDDWKVYGSNKVKGKINGGGLEFTLSSSHDNIYLRKK
jgi:hypothetical protein